jgi:preprotein translocase subunit SecB
MAKKSTSKEKAPEAGSEGASGEQAAPPVMINAQYVKDLSFEAPTAPGIFSVMQQKQPDISININVDHAVLEGNVSEVVLEFEVRCTAGDDVAFILELQYAGVFTINVPDEHRIAMLMVECPRLLFPFARNILATVSREAGFPPLMLGPVDFVAMFQSHIQQQDSAEAAPAENEG